VGVGGRDLRPLRLRPRHAAVRYELQSTAWRCGRTSRSRQRRAQRLAAGRARAAPRRLDARAGRRGRDARPRRRLVGPRMHDPEHRRDGAGPLRAAVQPGPDGEPAGYALFAARRLGRPRARRQRDGARAVAETPEARAGAVAVPARARPRAHAAVAAGARPRRRSPT
jgi:hypothetical protein